LTRHFPDRADAVALGLDLKHALAFANAVFEVDANGSRAQDLPHVLGNVLRLLRVSPFYIGRDWHVDGGGHTTHDLEHRVEGDLLAVVVPEGVGDGRARGRDGWIAELFYQARFVWISNVR
jgi:hypothetical protein